MHGWQLTEPKTYCKSRAHALVKRQIACLRFEELFEEHPELLSLKFHGDPDCEEGSNVLHLLVEAEIDEALAKSGAAPWGAHEAESAARGIVDAEWTEDFERVRLTRADHARKAGHVLMGAHEHARWQALRVQHALEKSVAAASAPSKSSPRI